LYVLKGREATLDDSVEREFAHAIENPFYAVRAKLLSLLNCGIVGILDCISSEERAVIARYLACQFMRTPRERDASNLIGIFSASKVVDDALRTNEWRRISENLGKSAGVLQRGLIEYTRAASEEGKFWLRTGLRNAERLANLLYTHFEWRLILVPSCVELVTCDEPVVCATRTGTRGEFTLGGAWKKEGFEATLALTPSHVLYLTRTIEDEAYLRTDLFARSVWSRTIANARRDVYSRSPNPAIAAELDATRTARYVTEIAGREYDATTPGKIRRALRRHDPSELPIRLRS